MKLHEDKDAFGLLLENIHEKTGYRTDVLEKDYYVLLILQELSNFQADGLPAYFKGGTALYKALKTTNRFSEDIDLSVDTRGCSRTQNDKRLERATKKYVSLPRDAAQGKTNRSEVIAVYTYDPITAFDADDVLRRVSIRITQRRIPVIRHPSFFASQSLRAGSRQDATRARQAHSPAPPSRRSHKWRKALPSVCSFPGAFWRRRTTRSALQPPPPGKTAGNRTSLRRFAAQKTRSIRAAAPASGN